MAEEIVAEVQATYAIHGSAWMNRDGISRYASGLVKRGFTELHRTLIDRLHRNHPLRGMASPDRDEQDECNALRIELQRIERGLCQVATGSNFPFSADDRSRGERSLLGRSLTAGERKVLDAVVREWKSSRDWPSAVGLVAEFAEAGDIDFRQAAGALDPQVLRFQRQGHRDERVTLTPLGYALSPGSDAFVDGYLCLIRKAAAAFIANPTAIYHVSKQDFRDCLQDGDIDLLSMLVLNESGTWWWRSSGTNKDNWQIGVNTSIVQFEAIKALPEVLGILARHIERRNELEESHGRLLELIYKARCDEGKWPSTVEFILRHRGDLDVYRLLSELPSKYWHRESIDDVKESKIRLNLEGLAACPEAKEDLDLAARIIGVFYEHFLKSRGRSPINAVDVAGSLVSSPEATMRAGHFLMYEGGSAFSIIEDASNGWLAYIQEAILHYRGVHSFGELLSVKRAKSAASKRAVADFLVARNAGLPWEEGSTRRFACTRCGRTSDTAFPIGIEDRALCPDCVKVIQERSAGLNDGLIRLLGVGTRFGHFVLERRLGGGGFGEVWLARDEKLTRDVALKFPIGAGGEDFKRHTAEARAAAPLQHPNVAKILSIEEYDGRSFIVMEYIDGVTLENAKELSLIEKVHIMRGVAAAVHAAHQRRIIHRDLKPSNIMIRRDGVPFVTDFGLARNLDASQRISVRGEWIGTPAYASPEQHDGKDADERSDIYSLGVILHELIYGVLPGSDGPLDQEPSDLPRTLKGVVDVIRRCLQKDPAARFQAAGDLQEALDHAIAVAPTPPPPPSAP